MNRKQLQTLIRLREAARDERRAALASALDAEQIVKQQQHQLELEQRSWEAHTRQAAEGSVNVDSLAQLNRYRWILSHQKKQLEVQLDQLAAEVERRRSALVEADQQLKQVEKLAERLDEAEREAAERRRQRELDEIATRQWHRHKV